MTMTQPYENQLAILKLSAKPRVVLAKTCETVSVT